MLAGLGLCLTQVVTDFASAQETSSAELLYCTSKTGSRSRNRLQFIEQDNDTIVLKGENNGRLSRVPIERLSEDDLCSSVVSVED